jgi:hypothetical protein
MIFAAGALSIVPVNFLIAHTALALERIHRITVVNRSAHNVTSLRLTGGMEHEFGPLPPDARRTRKFVIQREGQLMATAEVNRRTSQVVLDEWVHPQKGAGQARTITVTPEGELHVTHD